MRASESGKAARLERPDRSSDEARGFQLAPIFPGVSGLLGVCLRAFHRAPGAEYGYAAKPTARRGPQTAGAARTRTLSRSPSPAFGSFGRNAPRPALVVDMRAGWGKPDPTWADPRDRAADTTPYGASGARERRRRFAGHSNDARLSSAALDPPFTKISAALEMSGPEETRWKQSA